jgi:hypothetical protein
MKVDISILTSSGLYRDIDLDQLESFLFHKYGDEEVNVFGMTRTDCENISDDNMWINKSELLVPKYKQMLKLSIENKFMIDDNEYQSFIRDQKINKICEDNIS